MNAFRTTLIFMGILIICGIFGAESSHAGLTTAKVTIKVIDEEGTPVDGANIEIGFFTGIDGNKFTFVRGATDGEGRFSGSAASSDHLSGGVTKAGYYNSVFVYDFSRRNRANWIPWNPEIEVVLRPIVNPVAMYQRGRLSSNAELRIPEIGKEIGFDLIKSDWVAPYGQGVHSDFIFKAEKKYQDIDNFRSSLSLTFANKFDGIQVIKDDLGGRYRIGSVFKLPRIAPNSGYQSILEKSFSAKTVKKGVHYQRNQEEDNNYIFRVRSEIDEEEQEVKAMYGKIVGDIGIEPRGTDTMTIIFNYSLNPDYTRNLEHDSKQNLLKR